jgi:hypothetical protein
MFTTDSETRLSYFRPGSLQPLYMFELCGLLFAIAIYNGISLPVSFPVAFYAHLCGKRGDLRSLADGWPVIKKSLDRVLDGDVPGIDNTFSLEANGLRLTVLPESEPRIDPSLRIILPVVDATAIIHHGSQTHASAVDDQGDSCSSTNYLTVDIDSISDAWPGWHLVKAPQQPVELTNETKSTWVKEYATWLTFGSVAPQFAAFQKGFNYLLDDLSMISFQYLKPMFEGSKHLDINELRRVTTYDGFEPASKYIQNFWRLIASWPEEKQKQLLKFVTACERIPPGGASRLTFRIQRATTASMDHLPTSSTCFGTLMLPKYGNVDVLDRKLSLALKYGVEGFGSG